MTTLFTIIVGLDGTGKSTMAPLLAERLNAWQTREPFCEGIREELRSETDQTNQLISFLRDRLTHNRIILDELKTRDVICDRYWPCNVAYQGQKIGYQTVLTLQPNTNIKPDVCIHITSELDTIRSRMEKRGEPRMDRQTYDSLTAGYEIALRHLDIVPRQPVPRHESHKCRVLRLKGEGDLESNVLKAVQFIEETRKMIGGEI